MTAPTPDAVEALAIVLDNSVVTFGGVVQTQAGAKAATMLRALNTCAHPAPEASAGVVIGADREAANALMLRINAYAESLGIPTTDELLDDGPLVQSFARHRLAHAPGFDAARDRAVEAIEAEARRYAGMYPEGSDGRNTFVIFADAIQRIALAAIQPQGERGEGE